MTFRVGQKVVCVKEFPHGVWADCKPPRENRVYTIRAIRNCTIAWGVEFLLFEIVNAKRMTVAGYGEPSYHQERFRPVVEGGTDIAIFKKALIPSGRKIREDA